MVSDLHEFQEYLLELFIDLQTTLRIYCTRKAFKTCGLG
jgi:hypothetical protein